MTEPPRHDSNEQDNPTPDPPEPRATEPGPPSPETPGPGTPGTPSPGTPGPGTPGTPEHETPAPNTPPHLLRYAARTDPGLVRTNNEDSYFVGDRLAVVADGMGGHAAGEVASRLVVDAFTPLNESVAPDTIVNALEVAIHRGNEAIASAVEQHPQLDGMGTTVTAMVFDGAHAGLAHVGDSRAYLYRDQVLHQLTHDDTFVQSLVDEGRITEAQAHDHPQRNLVLRALTGHDLDPSITTREIFPGDRYLLCSDGLSGVVEAELIADALAHPDPEIAVETLVQLALVAGGPDNVTVVVVDVIDTGVVPDPDERPAPSDATVDPSITAPITRITRQMPRVPLPPIPEEPAQPTELLDDLDDDGFPGDEIDDHDEVPGDTGPHADGGGRPPGGRIRAGRIHWWQRTALLIVLLAVIAGMITTAILWSRSQYYVGSHEGTVTVFRGVDGSILGWRLATVEEDSCRGRSDCIPLRLTDLQPAAQFQVQAGIKATSLATAREVIDRLDAQLLPPCPTGAPSLDPYAHIPGVNCREVP